MSHPKLATARSGYGGRGYRIPGRGHWDAVDSKNKPKWTQIVYPSVTTVLKQVAKPGLHQWIADQTAAAAVANLPLLMTLSEEVGWGKMRFYWSRTPELVGSEIRQHYEGVRDDAAEIGTNIHEWVEAEIDGLMAYPEPMGIETEQMIEAFIEWSKGHTILPYHAEFTVVNDELGIAGTADADWDIRCDHGGPTCLGQGPGEFIRTLVDLKSSRNTWREHGMQLAALASAKVLMREVAEGTEGAMEHERTVDGKREKSWWIEEAAPEFSCYALLHIRPNDLDTKGELIPAFCKLKDRTADLDIYYRSFEAALVLAQDERELKVREKSRGTQETED